MMLLVLLFSADWPPVLRQPRGCVLLLPWLSDPRSGRRVRLWARMCVHEDLRARDHPRGVPRPLQRRRVLAEEKGDSLQRRRRGGYRYSLMK